MADRRKDRPPLWVERHGDILRPVTRYDIDRVRLLPSGKTLRADFRQDRSPVHHRFYWALLGIVAGASDAFGGNAEMLHRWLKLKLGMIEEVRFFDGSAVLDLTSTSWLTMDQVEFRAFFDRAIHLIITEVIPGARRAYLVHEAEAMLGIRETDIWKEAA